MQKLKLETTGFKDTETVWYGDIKEVPICESKTPFGCARALSSSTRKEYESLTGELPFSR